MLQEIHVKSTIDGTLQPSLFMPTTGRRPLLVALHTWSYDRFNMAELFPPFAKELDFHLLLPEFRGPNLTTNPHCTQACGSRLAMQDILDAIDHVCGLCDVDEDNIFLSGHSGGGHMALMMAGYAPERFRAITSFVAITDLAAWHGENPHYAPHIAACCSDSLDEMRARSPMSYIDSIARSNTKLFHGLYDPSVPVHHSIDLFTAVQAAHPGASVYLDIFDGGHEHDMELDRHWIMSQYSKEKRGAVTG